MPLTEQELVKRCKKGDRQAQNELYRRFKAPLFGVCLRYAGNREEAKDMLQDGFIHIFKDLYQYRPTGALGAWMRRVVINKALQHIRRKKHLFAPVELEQIADQYEAGDDLMGHFRAQALMEMIQQLPYGYRTVFNLYVIEGYSHKEIAEQLEISEATSKSQLSRAKATLRKLLEKVA